MPLTLDESDGYLDVNVAPIEGEAFTVRLDLYEANNLYAQLCDRFDPQGKPVELQAAWCDWLVDKGFPPVSAANGLRVLAAVLNGVAEFKKKHAPASATAASPAPSASPGSPAASPT